MRVRFSMTTAALLIVPMALPAAPAAERSSGEAQPSSADTEIGVDSVRPDRYFGLDPLDFYRLRVRIGTQHRVRVHLGAEREPVELISPELTSLGLSFEDFEARDSLASPIEFDRVTRISVRGGAAKTGALVGGAVFGVGIGIAAAAVTSDPPLGGSGGSGGEILGAGVLGAAAGGVVGALLGAIVGAGIPQWHDAYERP